MNKKRIKYTCKICNITRAVKTSREICMSCERDSLPEKKCLYCKKSIPKKLSCKKNKFCNVKCDNNFRKGKPISEKARSNRVGKKHSSETKIKIALGNSKPCTAEKAKKISDVRKYKPTKEQLVRLQELWNKKYVLDNEIIEIVGIGPRSYKRIKKEYCKIETIKFLPSDLRMVETEKIIDLASQRIHYKDIANIIGRGFKQTENILNKLNIEYVRRRPKVSSDGKEPRTEAFVRKWLDEINVQYRQWEYLEVNSKWEFDFIIKNSNILLEVQGDYWHCNPKVYRNGPINEWQKYSRRRDYIKRKYAKNKNYKLIYIWEKDINENNKEFFNKLEGQIKNAINIT